MLLLQALKIETILISLAIWILYCSCVFHFHLRSFSLSGKPETDCLL